MMSLERYQTIIKTRLIPHIQNKFWSPHLEDLVGDAIGLMKYDSNRLVLFLVIIEH